MSYVPPHERLDPIVRDLLEKTPEGDFIGLGLTTPDKDLAALKRLVADQTMRCRGRRPFVVEVGSWTGRTAIAMADAGADVLCVDHWKGSPGDTTGNLVRSFTSEGVYQIFLRNIGDRHGTTIKAFHGSSISGARHVAKLPQKPDMVFLDGSHDYVDVLTDIRFWQPLVRPGGILCGHDLTQSFPGVARAVVETGDFKKAGHCLWVRQL